MEVPTCGFPSLEYAFVYLLCSDLRQGYAMSVRHCLKYQCIRSFALFISNTILHSIQFKLSTFLEKKVFLKFSKLVIVTRFSKIKLDQGYHNST